MLPFAISVLELGSGNFGKQHSRTPSSHVSIPGPSARTYRMLEKMEYSQMQKGDKEDLLI